MSATTYEEIALRWKPENKRDHIFNILSVFVLACFIGAGITVSTIKVPKPQRESHISIPERVAKYISERPQLKPKPKLHVLPKPVPLPPPLRHKRKKVPSKPLTKIEKKARKKAESSGLLALTKQLSDIMDTSRIDSMVGKKINHARNANTKAGINSNILTAASGKGKININQNIHAGSAGQVPKLDNNQRQLARQLLAAHGEIAHAHNRHTSTDSQRMVRGSNLRSEEDVAYVMDKHKSMLHSLYRRARRTHPGLKGKIILEITILPSGKVSKVRVVSSELHDRSLEHDLVARIRLFDFGARPVEALTVTIPVEFLPS
jgi:protein TonB